MTLDEAIKHCEEVAIKMECESMCVEEAYQTAKQADCEKCAEEHRQLAEWLKDYKRLLEHTRWIPVSERLPKEVGTYLITLKDGDVSLCDFNPYCFADRTSLSIVAIAWMPLPKPYKAESGVDNK